MEERNLSYRYSLCDSYLWKAPVSLNRGKPKEDGQTVNECKGMVGLTGLLVTRSPLLLVFQHWPTTTFF